MHQMNKANKHPFDKRISSLKLANLESFVAVAKLGSFSKAAQQLHLTQPSISRQIAQLEQAFGLRLFDRLPTCVVLSDAGREALQACEQSLEKLYHAKQQLAAPSGHLSGELKLSVSGYIAESFLHPILSGFITAHPNVLVDIQLTSHSKESYNNLETGQADLVLATLPKKQQALLKQTVVWEDPLYFVTNQQHPLAQKKNHHTQQSQPNARYYST